MSVTYNIMAEVTVMYRTGHTIRDRWGVVLMHGGGALWVCFQSCGKTCRFRSSAMSDATFDLLGIHVTNNLYANAPATR